MLKRNILLFFIAFIVVLSGCSSEAAKGEKASEQTKKVEKKGFPDKSKKDDRETYDSKEDSKFKKNEEKEEAYIDEDGKVHAEPLLTSSRELTEEEVYLMMIYMFDQVDSIARNVMEKHTDEFYSPNKEKVIIREAKKLEKQLIDYITSQNARKYAEAYLEWLSCECDANPPFNSRYLHAGFKVSEFSKSTIEAESLHVTDGALNPYGYKFEWRLKKEDGKWKLADINAYSSKDIGDLELTFEDIENSFFYSESGNYWDYIYINRPVEFVEYFEEGGITYLAVYFPPFDGSDGYYEVYNTELAAVDFRFNDRYE